MIIEDWHCSEITNVTSAYDEFIPEIDETYYTKEEFIDLKKCIKK